MKLEDVLSGTDVESVKSDIEISGLEYDSRKVKKGDLFFAIKGEKSNGNDFIKDAISKGASAIVTDNESNIGETVILSSKSIRKTMAIASSNFYNDPSGRISLLGVTGTNGKTTTTYLLKHILENSGYKAGLLGTIDYTSGDTVIKSTLTTPECIDINRMLTGMIDSGMKYCAMEVSSIALVMDRVYGLNFRSAIYSNLTNEHLDFHKNMENYFHAKKILFDSMDENSVSLSNADDKYGESILSNTRSSKIFYSIYAPSDFKASSITSDISGLKFVIEAGEEKVKIDSKLNGRFNVYNILSAFAALKSMGFDSKEIAEGINNFTGVPGRFNKIELPNKAIAIIDYSHTSDSLKNAVISAKEILVSENKKGKLITVFGCGGNKDKTKRPVMGDIAVTNSDIAIITSDNPRYEDPFDIIDQILAGVGNHKNYEVIENREAAIKRGLELCKEGDIILICGKGHETYQEVKGVRTVFDDREMVLKYKESAKG